MPEIRFYHLEHIAAQDALPALLQKALQGGKRIVIKTADQRNVKQISEYLWTHNPNTFIPHGTSKEGQADRQPIWITDKEENPNNADVLILIDDTHSDTVGDFALCCIVFDGRTPETLQNVRTRWKTYKEQGLPLTYWQQTPQGWEQKASENQDAA